MLDLHQHLGATATRPPMRAASSDGGSGSVSRISRWSVQSPPFSTFEGMPGQRRDAAECPAAAGERERGDVVLLAVVIARERRRPEEVDCAVGPDEAATGEGRRRDDRDEGERGGDPAPARTTVRVMTDPPGCRPVVVRTGPTLGPKTPRRRGSGSRAGAVPRPLAPSRHCAGAAICGASCPACRPRAAPAVRPRDLLLTVGVRSVSAADFPAKDSRTTTTPRWSRSSRRPRPPTRTSSRSARSARAIWAATSGPSRSPTTSPRTRTSPR